MPRRCQLTMTDALKKRTEPLAIPLSISDAAQLRRFRIRHLFSAGCCLVLAILSANTGSIAIVFGLYAVAILLRMALWPFYHKRYQLLVDDRGIRGQISWREYIDCPWDKIAGADLGLLFLELYMTDGKIHRVSLRNLTRQDHHELRPRLEEILIQHRLPRIPRRATK